MGGKCNNIQPIITSLHTELDLDPEILVSTKCEVIEEQCLRDKSCAVMLNWTKIKRATTTYSNNAGRTFLHRHIALNNHKKGGNIP